MYGITVGLGKPAKVRLVDVVFDVSAADVKVANIQTGSKITFWHRAAKGKAQTCRLLQANDLDPRMAFSSDSNVARGPACGAGCCSRANGRSTKRRDSSWDRKQSSIMKRKED